MSDYQNACPLPSRRQWQAEREAAEQKSVNQRSSKPGAATRGLLLGVLTSLTVVVPVAGIVDVEHSVALPVRMVGKPVASSTWVTTAASDSDTKALVENVAAASRARARSAIMISQCVGSETAAAGGRVVTETGKIMYPMEAGSFEYTSPFGYRIHPVLGYSRLHEGADYAAPLGTPIYAIAAGEVTEVEAADGAGTVVQIRHTDDNGETFYTQYLHQYMDQILVSVGQQVEAGERIGSVGNNGYSTGAHLHFEVRTADMEPIDPVAWLEENGALYIGQDC